MSIDQTIFPNNCYLAFMDNGSLSPTAELFLKEQTLQDWEGMGAEHPCFGCRVDDCNSMVVKYHDGNHKYIPPPKNPKPIR